MNSFDSVFKTIYELVEEFQASKKHFPNIRYNIKLVNCVYFISKERIII
jgi:hypothetical protein